ncbi:MAG: DUF1801 domain-containing protein [Chloroflexi bacterium]|nr:DUF1801 domain-containing protein [Chloroflexota bacterium]
MQELAARLRSLVRETVPDATEIAYPGWHGPGFRHPKWGCFCGMFPREDSVRLLFENGATILDPDGTLEGCGNQTRDVHIRRREDARVRPFKRLA